MIQRSTLLLPLLLGLSGCLGFQTKRFDSPLKPFGYVEIDGVRVHYRDVPAQGEAQGAVVMIHGYAGGLVSWLHAQPALSDRFRTLSLDLKGFGLTDKAPGDYSSEAQADLVAAFMDKMGVAKAHIVAHSWGCSVALALALRHPHKVDQMVLTSAFVYPEQADGFLRWSQYPLVGEALFWLFYDQQLETRYTWSYLEPERHVSAKGLDYLKAFQATPGVDAAALAVARGMHLDALSAQYHKVAHQTLLIWGREDRVADPRYGERLAALLPRARLEILARAGHAVMLERAGTYHELLRGFLK
ncbi:alpha/beta fold hydrolase [Myxococcota bacterium]|nr:alpha/beta fold hydrolase [Myxococcota bacterium]MBU1432830.1 alpha/beta fold hydrolase [Myxococcota bacterium]MBU1897544.1 alpha/beta fold hydrolase [Myxococcota bacterium]